MFAPQTKLAITAGLFLLVFLFGFWLSRLGKPYPTLLFTLHKLVALGTLVFLGNTVYRLHQAAPLDPGHLALVAFAALCFVATMVLGGLLSTNQAMPPVIHTLHSLVPYLTLLSSGASLYLLFQRSLLLPG